MRLNIVFVAIATIALTIGVTHAAQSELRLHSLFADGCGLQRAPATANVVGFASYANGVRKVTITSTAFPSTLVVKLDKNVDRWVATLPTVSASRGHTFLFSTNLGDQLTLYNVTFGDVYLTLGQSNMMYPLSVMDSKNQDLADARANGYYSLHLYNTMTPYYLNNTATTPQEDLPAKPSFGWTDKNSPLIETRLSSFGATSFYIGRQLQRNSPVSDVFVVSVAVPGTAVETWLPVSARTECGATATNPNPAAPSTNPLPRDPAGLYNGMIAPLQDLVVKGVFDYRGEANWYNPQEFGCLYDKFVDLITTEILSTGLTTKPKKVPVKVPFVFTELHPFPGSSTQPNFTLVRTAQREYIKNYVGDNVFMTVAGDLGDYLGPGGGLHPLVGKDVIGDRMSKAMLNMVSGSSYIIEPPVVKTVVVNNSSVYGDYQIFAEFTYPPTFLNRTIRCTLCNAFNPFEYSINGTWYVIDTSYYNTTDHGALFFVSGAVGKPDGLRYNYTEVVNRRAFSKVTGLPINDFVVASSAISNAAASSFSVSVTLLFSTLAYFLFTK